MRPTISLNKVVHFCKSQAESFGPKMGQVSDLTHQRNEKGVSAQVSHNPSCEWERPMFLSLHILGWVNAVHCEYLPDGRGEMALATETVNDRNLARDLGRLKSTVQLPHTWMFADVWMYEVQFRWYHDEGSQVLTY